MANALLSVFLHQKKAEEAHRILEGLGPRVELVSEDLNSFLTFIDCLRQVRVEYCFGRV